MISPAKVREIAEAMAQARILRLEFPDASAEASGVVRIELHPSAFAAPPDTTDPSAALEALAKANECACGHDRISEHNSAGLCIAGACPYSVCHPGATPKPEEG